MNVFLLIKSLGSPHRIMIFLCAVSCVVFSFFSLYRHVSEPEHPKSTTSKDANAFKSSLHLTNIKKDSLVHLIDRVCASRSVMQQNAKTVSFTISGLGTIAPDLYNNNRLLLDVHSDAFSVRHNTTNGEVVFQFSIYNKSGIDYLSVPNDVLIGFIEKLNPPHEP